MRYKVSFAKHWKCIYSIDNGFGSICLFYFFPFSHFFLSFLSYISLYSLSGCCCCCSLNYYFNFLHYLLHLQGACESVPTHTLSRRAVAGASGATLAALQAALPKAPGRTRVLAVPSDVARRTLTRTLHRVAEGAVLTLALLAAVRPPVLVVTGCNGTEKKQTF